MLVPLYDSPMKIFDTHLAQTPQILYSAKINFADQTDVNYHLLGSIPLGHEDLGLFGKSRFESINSKVKEQIDMMELVDHRDTITHEKIITNNPILHEKKNLTFEEKINSMRADIEKSKRDSEESKRDSEESRRDLNQVMERLDLCLLKTERLEIEKASRYEGETINMRKKLWKMACIMESTRQKISVPSWMENIRKRRNQSAHLTDLATVMKLADKYPDYFDILLDTIYGASKSEIKLLICADKTGENQVYRILNDRGSAFHNQYANTCIKPFNFWLSAVRGLQNIQSATADKSSSVHESCVQKQKAEVQKLIREWDAAFDVDKLKWDTNTEKCRELIYSDYRDRDLLPRMWKSFGV
ncbi:hypothetical protein BOTNAR_2744g00010 [Botryotinia narcissicola]|uniref:Uncharacterized protein n=1 Tax=Botryotinia narcissicola TaxID=278944 RepID=A0A4Z1H433_9HELO|nr:hypothetical protein BOTNAR_2744g00010 [Botryotinia narcissicola]